MTLLSSFLLAAILCGGSEVASTNIDGAFLVGPPASDRVAW